MILRGVAGVEVVEKPSVSEYRIDCFGAALRDKGGKETIKLGTIYGSL